MVKFLRYQNFQFISLSLTGSDKNILVNTFEFRRLIKKKDDLRH